MKKLLIFIIFAFLAGNVSAGVSGVEKTCKELVDGSRIAKMGTILLKDKKVNKKDNGDIFINFKANLVHKGQVKDSYPVSCEYYELEKKVYIDIDVMNSDRAIEARKIAKAKAERKAKEKAIAGEESRLKAIADAEAEAIRIKQEAKEAERNAKAKSKARRIKEKAAKEARAKAYKQRVERLEARGAMSYGKKCHATMSDWSRKTYKIRKASFTNNYSGVTIHMSDFRDTFPKSKTCKIK